jgi:hypothetical protein
VSDVQKPIIITGVGLLSDFHLMHYSRDAGFEVGTEVEIDGKKQEFGDFSNGIQLAPHLKLRFSSKGDADSLSNYPNIRMNYLQHRLNKYVIESSFEIENRSKRLEVEPKIHQLICNAVTGLRLLKSGYIDSNTILWLEEQQSKKHASLEWQRAIPTASLAEPYYLRTDEISKLTKLMNKISEVDIEKRKPLKIALSRFENSYYSVEDENKLIDYMIGFEALFTERTMRSQHDVIPVACAMLLGKSEKERENIRCTLDYAYTLRNAIVHGADYKEKFKNEQPFQEFVSEVEELLRRSIRELL